MPAERSTRSFKISHPGRVAFLIYGGASFLGAAAFFLVTTFTGSYPAVARYGGTVWVFLLMMIVLMPIVIPRVRARVKARVEDLG